MDPQKLTSHIEAFETQANNLEKALKKIPKDQTDPDGITNTRERVKAQIASIRVAAAADKASLEYDEARPSDEPSIEELAQQEVDRELRELELARKVQELREAHPDIDTSQDQT